MKKLWCCLLLGSFSVVSEAHPTSFEGSTGLMGEHSSMLSHNQLNHSWKYWFATGLHYYQRPRVGDDDYAVLASSNFLVKRWNMSNLQANLYALGGAGYSNFKGSGSDAYLAGAQFDIEDRDYYLLLKHKHLFSMDGSDYQTSVLRLGFTPYVDGFDGIHSWLILDVGQSRFWNESPTWEVTPTLRVFYRNLLFEIGHSFSGNMNFNYIAHF